MSEEQSPGQMRYWGEIPALDEMPEDFADMLIQSAMKPLAMKVHEPCEEEEPGTEELPPECSAMDETVLHTIKLLQYAKSMQRIIDKMKRKEIIPKDSKDFIPPIFPEQTNKKPHRCITNPFHYMEQTPTPFVEGIGKPANRLSETNAHLILRKCVATIFAHIGYDDTEQFVLDILTDICEEYFIKFTRLLRVAVDHELLSGSVGFPDVMERVFHEMGIGSVLILHDFYQKRILMYHQKVLSRCRLLACEYSKLTAPVTTKKVVGKTIKIEIKEGEGEEYDNIPELHFPAQGNGCSAEELRPSLEPGFQMLHRIEQEEQLQNMVKEEEMTISNSPKH